MKPNNSAKRRRKGAQLIEQPNCHVKRELAKRLSEGVSVIYKMIEKK